MRAYLFAAAAAASLALASPSGATIILGSGAGVLQPDENLLFTNDPAPGSTLEGITNQTDTLLAIMGGETLVGTGGQARLEADDGAISSLFTYQGATDQLLGFDFADAGTAFTETEFRLFGGSATQATLTFVDTDGQIFTQTFTIPANGFFNAHAEDGQLIDYFSIAANGTVGDVRQIRIGGVQAIPVGVVPEPATWALMIAGFGGAGAVLRRRRTQVACA